MLYILNIYVSRFLSRRRKNGKRNRKHRRKGGSGSDSDNVNGNGWYSPNDYDVDGSPSSFQRETSNKYQLNIGECFQKKTFFAT